MKIKRNSLSFGSLQRPALWATHLVCQTKKLSSKNHFPMGYPAFWCVKSVLNFPLRFGVWNQDFFPFQLWKTCVFFFFGVWTNFFLYVFFFFFFFFLVCERSSFFSATQHFGVETVWNKCLFFLFGNPAFWCWNCMKQVLVLCDTRWRKSTGRLELHVIFLQKSHYLQSSFTENHL